MNMAAGISMLDSTFAAMGVQISYRRGETTLASGFLAKLGSTLFRADDHRGVTIRTEQRDFIFRMADLPAGFEPEPTDEIIHDGHRYMVSAPNGEPCWRWHTRLNHSQIRVHAHHAGIES